MSPFDQKNNLSQIGDTSSWSITTKVPKGHINFSISEPNFPTPGTIRNAAQEIVLSEDLSYSPTQGMEELRELISSRFQYPHKIEGCTIATGASEALYSVIYSMVKPGDTVLIPGIGNPSYQAVVEFLGAQPVRYPISLEEKIQFRAEELEHLCTEKVKAILINSPLDPTGQVETYEEITKIANSCESRGIYLILDESYHEIVFDHRIPNFSGFGKNVIIFSSLSKLFSMAGWRIGWILSHPEIAARINNFRKFVTTCAPTISQRVALRIFQGAGKESSDKIISFLANRRKLMIEMMKNEELHTFQDPVAGYYLFFNYQALLKVPVSSFEFTRRLSEDHSVSVVPGIIFGEPGEGHIRISFATDERSIQDGIKRIKEMILSINETA